MTMRDAAAQGRLSSGLQPAVQAVARARGQAALRRALARLTARAPWLCLVLLVIAIVLSQQGHVPFYAPAAAALLLGGLVLIVTFARARAQTVRLLDAARSCDDAHDNKDRLSAALDLAAAPRTDAPLGEALAAAAIEDGLHKLLGVDPQRITTAATAAAPRPFRALLSLLLLAALTALLPAPAGPRTGPDQPPANDHGTVAAEPSPRTDVAAAERTPPPGVAATPSRPEASTPRTAAGKRGDNPPPSKTEPTPAVPASSGAGKTGSDEVGDSAESGAPKAAPSGTPGAGRPGGGQGAAAAGAAEPSPEQPKPPAVASKPKPKQPSKPSPDQEQKASDSAGSPSGPSRGSGRMSPVGNKRQDLNRGMEREDDPDIDDEPVEDETDEQEQRGGITPMKRQDQRPAARELSISGDGPPDQGRGGPTPPKKSRGTASLVLGLRLPDQVRGQPNPGTAKTSMEQIPPRRQHGEPGLALPAAPGRLGTPQSLRPVANRLQLLLQAYHARLAEQDPKPSPASQPQNR